MILVTGGTGLLGSHLLIELSRSPKVIRAIYRDKNRIGQVEKIFRFYLGDNWSEAFSRIQWVEGDILDIPSLESAMKGVETVYHCAAMVSFARRDFYSLMKVNREGTANIVNTALFRNVKTLCYVSSTAAIGGRSGILSNEKTKWEQSPHTSSYSISKYSAEKEVWRGVEEGLDCIIVNPCVIFGPGNWDESSLTIFRTVNNGLRFYTSGQNAYVDVRDVAEIMVRLTESTIRNERYLCIGGNLTFKEMLSVIARQLGKREPSIETPRWLVGLTWRLSAIVSLFTGNKPAITKDSARNAFNVMSYDATKICEKLDFKFKSLEETVENTIKGRIQ